MNYLTSLPPSLFQLKDLQVLYLCGNNLSCLPKEIANLKSLKMLDLGGNSIKDIPNEICELSNLELLYLAGNNAGYKSDPANDLSTLADSLPEDIGNLSKLRDLTIQDYPITQLPKSLFNLTELEEIGICLPLKSVPQNLENWAYVHNVDVWVNVLEENMESDENGPLQAEIDRLLHKN